MIILSEAPDPLLPSPHHETIHTSTEVARLLGFPIHPLAIDHPQGDLSQIPAYPQETPGIWLGLPPSPDRYAAIYQAAGDRNIRLLNTPPQHLLLQELDRGYPLLEGLTPPSLVLTGVEQVEEAIARFGLPLFVRGAVHSRKAEGWSACVAHTEADLRHRVATLLHRPDLSRGRVIVRPLVPLRHHRRADDGFPLGREYRVFLYRQHLITYGYAWSTDDPLRYIRTVKEEEPMLEVVYKAAARLNVPFVAIDVAQQEDGTWIIIETSDPQFSSTAQIPLIQFWRTLRTILS